MAAVLVREPIYLQVSNHLRRLIASPESQIGGKFSNATKICASFGLSRAPAGQIQLGTVFGGE